MERFLKKTGWVGIINSIIFAIVGLLLIFNSDTIIKIISYVLGTVFILAGVVKLANYFVAKGNYNFFNYELIYGIIAIVLGLVTLFFNGAIEFVFRLMVGLWIIYSGGLRVSLSFNLKSINSKIWIFSLIVAILIILTGAYMIITLGAVLITMGIIILIYAIMDFIESIIFIQKVNEIL